jgi:hypothetical protein
MAAAFMKGEREGQTLQATALVHEVYLRGQGNHSEITAIFETSLHFGCTPSRVISRQERSEGSSAG